MTLVFTQVTMAIAARPVCLTFAGDNNTADRGLCICACVCLYFYMLSFTVQALIPVSLKTRSTCSSL